MPRQGGDAGLHSLSTCGNEATARCRELVPRCASCGNAGSVQAVALRLKINLAFSAIVVGLARGILVIASDGMIIDTILNALATGLGGIPAVLFTTLLYAVENLLAILVPSSSGLAALTAPIFGPLTELMGLNPEAAVWALSMGSATMSLICPTSAILVAGLGVCKIKLGQWWKTVWKFFLVVSLINIVFVAISGLIAL